MTDPGEPRMKKRKNPWFSKPEPTKTTLDLVSVMINPNETAALIAEVEDKPVSALSRQFRAERLKANLSLSTADKDNKKRR